MHYELNYLAPPDSYYDSHLDYDSYRCGYCADSFTDEEEIHRDSLTNGNICNTCLNSPDHQIYLRLTDYQFKQHIEKITKQKPINPF